MITIICLYRQHISGKTQQEISNNGGLSVRKQEIKEWRRGFLFTAPSLSRYWILHHMCVSPIQKQRNKYHFLKINKTFKTLNFKTKLSLLQEIFQTQEWNRGLLHCMQILDQLSFVGSPKVKVKVTQSCLTLCNPWTGVLQARILEWVAFPFSRGSFQPRDRTQVSHIAGGVFTTWATREAQNESLSVLSDSLWPHELYSPWSSPGQNTGLGNFFPFPADLPNPGIELGSPALQVDSLPTELSGKPPRNS